jgi:glycosyltransferase involved in cell wall biosynthesis
MKLGIFSNFIPPHQGGSEKVIEDISTRLVQDYNYDISVYGFSCKKESVYKGFDLIPCKRGNELISQINQNEHVFTYSDSFWGFDTIVENIDQIKPVVSCALVGMYNMLSKPQIFQLFKKNLKRFRPIEHRDSGEGYVACARDGWTPRVIPNGVNISEFRENNIDFRQKYNISKDKKILLSVSNYFFGKGQDALPDIYRELLKKRNDFEMIQISNSVNYPYDKLFLNRCKKKSEGLNIRFLRDLPREDVVSAFNNSDVFIFPSLKEVAPLVINECRAAKLPFVSNNVGDVYKQRGGVDIRYDKIDDKGYIVINDRIIKDFADFIDAFLNNISLVTKTNGWRDEMIARSEETINKLDWSNIVPLYDEIFNL